MTWFYNGSVFESSDIGDYVGFVYIITDLTNDMKYLGQKQFYSTKTLPPLKGKVKKRRKKVESDWQNYFGSSETIKALVKEYGPSRFERTILRLCKSKSECNYYETKLQFENDVLFRDDFYNGIINCRISKNQVKSWANKKET